MALIRLAFAADLPTPDEALKALKKNRENGPRERSPARPVAPARASAPQAEETSPPQSAQIIDILPPLSQRPPGDGPGLQSFDDVVRLAGKHRDAKLRTELEAYIHIVSFAEGRIDLRLHDDAPEGLANRLTQRLKEWTGRQWVVVVSNNGDGAETVRDRRYAEVMADPLVKKALELFPGAEVTAIREPDLASAPAPDDMEEDPPVDPDDLPQIDTAEDKRGTP
jgi:DNA polymerase III subunit gamma/tau